MARMKGGELIVETLIQEKMPYVFGICGHGNVGILDALHAERDRIKLVSPRHEQAAGHMADAYFRVRHSPVATLTSCGPGSANLVMSLACALSDSSAFLAITANVPTSQFNRSPFQELNRHYQADFPALMRPVVKRSFQPTRVEMLPLALQQAIPMLTMGRPGPVNLDVPYDLFQEEADVTLPPSVRGSVSHRSGAAPEEVKRVADRLAAARRPLLFIGHGSTLSEASAEITALADRYGIPVISSPNGMGCLDMTHPLSLGFIGRNGAYPANQAGRHCDLVLALGARFDDRSASSWIPGYSWNIPQAPLVHVDIDPAELGRNYPVAIGVVADVRTFARQLLAELEHRKLEPGRLAEWHGQIRGWQAEWERYVRPNFSVHAAPIRPERVVGDLQSVMPDEAILALDVGVHHNWFMQFWSARKPQKMLNSWGFSSMGFGVAGVLGAKLAAPDQPCVAVVGDGGFIMMPHVLCTAVEYDIPAIWVVWNNFQWAAIRDIQYGMFGGREIGTAFYRSGNMKEPYSPDFAAMARSCGVEGVTIKKSEDLRGALDYAIRQNKPCVLDVHVSSEIRPPSTGTWRLPPTPYKEPVFGKAHVPA